MEIAFKSINTSINFNNDKFTLVISNFGLIDANIIFTRRDYHSKELIDKKEIKESNCKPLIYSKNNPVINVICSGNYDFSNVKSDEIFCIEFKSSSGGFAVFKRRNISNNLNSIVKQYFGPINNFVTQCVNINVPPQHCSFTNKCSDKPLEVKCNGDNEVIVILSGWSDPIYPDLQVWITRENIPIATARRLAIISNNVTEPYIESKEYSLNGKLEEGHVKIQLELKNSNNDVNTLNAYIRVKKVSTKDKVDFQCTKVPSLKIFEDETVENLPQ
ncbi:DgyrCDS8604 [Dimorphilus gyrociliatus]|nr:DgyrCDS8604 [Dimorphilus gyrociliatus]